MIIKNNTFETYPIVCHFPGKSYRKNTICNNIYSYIKKNIIINPFINHDCAIVTVKSPNLNVSMLETQCNILGIPLTIIGTDIENYKLFGNLNKPKQFINYLENTNKQTILFVDYTDVLFCDDVQKIFNYFQSTDKTTIISTEKRFSYFWKRCDESTFKSKLIHTMLKDMSNQSKYYSLNTGAIIGDKDCLLKQLYIVDKIGMGFYHKNLPRFKKSDQSAWMYALLTENLYVKLDYTCDIFQTFTTINEGEIEIHDI